MIKGSIHLEDTAILVIYIKQKSYKICDENIDRTDMTYKY